MLFFAKSIYLYIHLFIVNFKLCFFIYAYKSLNLSQHLYHIEFHIFGGIG